eukprot:3919606-Rhodomonas_salina.2
MGALIGVPGATRPSSYHFDAEPKMVSKQAWRLMQFNALLASSESRTMGLAAWPAVGMWPAGNEGRSM